VQLLLLRADGAPQGCNYGRKTRDHVAEEESLKAAMKLWQAADEPGQTADEGEQHRDAEALLLYVLKASPPREHQAMVIAASSCTESWKKRAS
jgi:hypothetical protein